MRREHGLRPASFSYPFGTDAAADAGGLFIDDRGALVRLDVATGERRVVLGGR
jgi:hypothetical protein